jgi:hypothetical protein
MKIKDFGIHVDLFGAQIIYYLNIAYNCSLKNVLTLHRATAMKIK